MTLLLLDGREYSRQFGLHLIPGKVDASMVFQVPVDTRGDVYPGIASHHDLRAALVEFKKVLIALYQFGLELRRSALVNAFQELINRIRSDSE